VRRPFHVAAWLFLAFQALYALTSSGNVFRLPDEFEVYFQTESLVDRHRLSVPQTLVLTEEVRQPDGRVAVRPILFGKIGRDGEAYAPYGPFAAILAVPHHLAARAVAALAGVRREPLPGGRPWLVLVAGLTSLATSTATALTVVGFFFACLLLGRSVRYASTLSLALGVATPLWPYATSFFAEAFVASGLMWATVCLLLARRRIAGAGKWVVCASVLLAVTGLVKPTAIILLPGLVVAVLLDSSVPRRIRMTAAAMLCAGIAVAGAGHAGYNLVRFGSPLDFGYAWGETVAGGTPRPFALDELPRGLLVLLASPGKSLFVWAPVLLLVAARIPRAWRQCRAPVVGILMSAGIALTFYGSYFFPEGGYSHGPRHLVPLIPLLVLILAMAVDDPDPTGGTPVPLGSGGTPAPLGSSGTGVSPVRPGGMPAPLGSSGTGVSPVRPWGTPAPLGSSGTGVSPVRPGGTPAPLGRGLAVAVVMGCFMAAAAVGVSFVQDQTMGQDLAGRVRQNYYERVAAAPGRPWNRYRLDYVPFVQTLGSGPLGLAAPPGAGIDVFPLHLERARRRLPDMQAIPVWFPPALAASWLAVLLTAIAGLTRSVRDDARTGGHRRGRLA
jgi:hypothetical protein